MMYGYVKGYPLNALWGFKYGGTWKSVEEFERNSVTNTYVSALAINSDAASRKASLGMPRYYDINNDGSLNNDDLVYQGNADPDLYGGLQNNFRFGRLNVGIYFTYSLGGKIYNYSELYMAGSSMSNQYRYMLEAWHPVRNPQSNLPRAGAVDAHVPSDLMIYDASYIRLKNITVGYTFDLSKRPRHHAEPERRKPPHLEKVQWLRPRRLDRQQRFGAAARRSGRIPQAAHHRVQHPAALLTVIREHYENKIHLADSHGVAHGVVLTAGGHRRVLDPRRLL